MKILVSAIALMILAPRLTSAELIFEDDFQGKLGPGWSWLREHQQAWRTTSRGLEVRIEPGNLWGPQNNARNVLLRPAPDVPAQGLQVTVNVENHPTNQYEQVDLAWYYDDSHMVKLGLELVDGKLSIVMGREEADKTRTIAIIPNEFNSVQLQFEVVGNRIRGRFSPAGTNDWREAGECDLPVLPGGQAKLSLQFYQGGEKSEHWARVTGFRVARMRRRKHRGRRGCRRPRRWP